MYNFQIKKEVFLLLVKSGFEIQMNVVITLEIFSWFYLTLVPYVLNLTVKKLLNVFFLYLGLKLF